MLVRAGADVSVRNGVGRDAVGEAEVTGKVEVVEWLLCGEGRGVDGGVGEGEGEEEGLVGKGGEEEGVEGDGVERGEGTGEGG